MRQRSVTGHRGAQAGRRGRHDALELALHPLSCAKPSPCDSPGALRCRPGPSAGTMPGNSACRCSYSGAGSVAVTSTKRAAEGAASRSGATCSANAAASPAMQSNRCQVSWAAGFLLGASAELACQHKAMLMSEKQ